jgi:hypothetical protein
MKGHTVNWEDYIDAKHKGQGWVANGLYSDIASDIYQFCYYTYCQAAAILGKRPRLLKDMKCPPVRTPFLSRMHDVIAAQFRMKYQQELRPYIPDLLDRKSDLERTLEMWKKFYPTQFSLFLKREESLPRWILTAATYPDPDIRAIESERDVEFILEDIYYSIQYLRNLPNEEYAIQWSFWG